MEEIKKNLQYLYLNCDFTEYDGDTSSFDETLDKLDCILNMIEATNTHSLVDCNLAIKRLQKIINEEF